MIEAMRQRIEDDNNPALFVFLAASWLASSLLIAGAGAWFIYLGLTESVPPPQSPLDFHPVLVGLFITSVGLGIGSVFLIVEFQEAP